MSSQLDNAKKLLELGKGDIGRLEHIKQTIENNKELFVSDREYLQKLALQYLEENPSSITTDENNSSNLTSNESVDNKTLSHDISDSFCGKCGNVTKGENFCPKCGAPQEKQSESFCGKCGNKIYGNNPCSQCNLQYTPKNNLNSNYIGQRPPEWKSEGTTLVLTIVLGILGLGGIGHIYLGKIARGIGILIVGLILLVFSIATMGIGLIVLIPFAIWVIFDARDKCRYYNNYLQQNGKSPW